MRIKILGLLGLVLGLLLILSGCNPIPPDLQIQDYELKEVDYSWYVEGTAKNDGGDADLCSVDVKFYDENDTVLKSGLDSVTGLDGGETWDFEVNYYDEKDPDHVDVEGECVQY